MVSPAIALRFRDATPGVDTIGEHRTLLVREGAVWWGWWKKDFEDGHADYFKTWQAGQPVDLFIADRSTKRMFYATSIRCSVGSPDIVDPQRVPDYYREYIGNVFGWFLLRSIDEVPFLEDISDKLGEKTMIRLDSIIGIPESISVSSETSKGSCLLHLSDLHFGADYDFITQGITPSIGDQRKTLTESLLIDLRRVNLSDEIGAIVVTGDFTTGGDWTDETRAQILNEFAMLRRHLGLDKKMILAVPGNHDIVRYPPGTAVSAARIATGAQTTYKHERDFRTFVDELVGKNWKDALNYVRRLRFANVDLLICILNSCAIVATEWTEYGFVGTGGIDTLKKLSQEHIVRPTFKFMALHHHLLPVAGIEAPNSKGVTLSLDASELLDEAQLAGVQIALHGHQHMSRLVRYQTIPLLGGSSGAPLHIVSNGSTGVNGLRRPGSERNSYCIFKFEQDGLHLWIRELRPDGREGATLFDGLLETKPVQASGTL
jgi:3',5'-cyclic AMP phosphodiesterase CpdA